MSVSAAVSPDRHVTDDFSDRVEVDRRELWILNPWADLLLIANCLWPVLLWLGFRANLDGHQTLQFWQIYFVTTPHRWLTLFLVVGDKNRFRERSATFLILPIVFLGSCLAVRGWTGALTCLLTIDYLWNAWHFTAQHHGIYRIYARKADPSMSPETVHKWLFRFVLLFVIFRVAGWSWEFDLLEQLLLKFDYAAAAALIALVAWEVGLPQRSIGRSCYLVSVTLLYLLLLGAVHYRRPDLVLALATTSALFHATEYLAVVSWNVRDRALKEKSLGLIRQVAPTWGIFLIAFIAVLGSSGWYLERSWLNAWLTINVAMAFVHYAYDGLIWRRSSSRS